MKKIWLLVAAIAVISCQEKVPANYALVSGKVLNSNSNEITISSNDGYSKQIIKVAEDGTFKDTLRFKKGTYYFINGKDNTQIYLENGANIQVNFDANDFQNTIAFSGEGSGISSYLFEKRKLTKDLIKDPKAFYSLSETDYKIALTKIEKSLKEVLQSTKNLPKDYKTNEEKSLHYEYLSKLNDYETYHKHYAELEEFEISDGFLNELDGFDYEIEDDYNFSADYRKLVGYNNYSIAKELAQKDSIQEDIAALKTASLINNETIKNAVLFDNAKYNITYTENLEEFYNLYSSFSTDEENNIIITESYQKLKTVAKGNVSPKFENYENFAGGTTSLTDLKGKFVYVDVWATWCGPCKAEIPSLKELEKEYHDKNIEFVSISVDKLTDHDKWLKMVEEKQLGGIQLFADKSWNSDFVTGYLINGIPRFILIDTEGNIVSANAPRPSDPKLIEMFNNLNI
jgi:thiol-disulfide isomerase/thioredoxin